MGKIIYIIEAGEYSDYNVLGYCSTKEQAEKAVAFRNRGITNEDYRYSELDCLDDEAAQVDKIYVVYDIRYKQKQNGIGFTEAGWDKTTDYKWESARLRARDGIYGVYGTQITVTVWLEHEDIEKAGKIAHDKVAEYLAQINLID